MKNIKYTFTLLFTTILLFFTSCEKSDNYMASENDEIHLFIWRAMNNYYLI